MPNWCENQLTVSGPLAVVEDWVRHMQGPAVVWPDDLFAADTAPPVLPLCFHQGVPVPPDIIRQGFSTAGYHWCRTHWGTKWEPVGLSEIPAIETLSDGSALACYDFDTAWSPPIAWLDALVPQWPALTFVLRYGEPGMQDYGEYEWAHGVSVHQEIIDPDTQREWFDAYFPGMLEMLDDED